MKGRQVEDALKCYEKSVSVGVKKGTRNGIIFPTVLYGSRNGRGM